MHINVMVGYIGVVTVIPAFVKRQERKSAESRRCKDQDTRNTKNVNCVVSRHRTMHN